VHVSVAAHFFSVTSFLFSVEGYVLLVNKSLLSFTDPRTFSKEWKEVTTRTKKNESIQQKHRIFILKLTNKFQSSSK
jgi:hypothetical protein